MLKELTDLGISKLEAETLISKSKNIKKDLELIKQGYPIQYLIGTVNFYGYEISVNKNVLIPRYETELLVEKTIELINKNNFKEPKILDLCTGSGAIAIALSKKLDIAVDSSDISLKCLKTAKKNSKINNSSLNLIKSDLFNRIKDKYDVIISNPPYVSFDEPISTIVKNEPHQALYSNDGGMYHIKEIIKQSKNHINKKSIIAIEIGQNQANELLKFAKTVYKDSKIYIEKDLANKDRFLFILNNIE